MFKVETVATYILQKISQMTAMKLQKLVYYSQSWSLVWDERPLFDSEIQAWANGPVCPVLYSKHRGEFLLDSDKFGQDFSELDRDAIETLDAVLDYYGDKEAVWLSELTHAESPWKDARKGIPLGQRSSVNITHTAMAEYYGSL